MAADLSFHVGVTFRKVGPLAVLAEPLFFPEVSRLAADSSTAAEMVRRELTSRIPRIDTRELFRRRRATTARLLTFAVTVPPPRKNEAWRTPVVLRFHAVVWEQDGFVVARVPALGMEVIAHPKDDLLEILDREALSALRRGDRTTSLMRLAQAGAGPVRLEWFDLSIRVPSLKERMAAGGDVPAAKSVLSSVASAVRPMAEDPAYEAEETVARLAEALAAKPPQSVLLVGPSGVGKTAAFGELVRRAASHELGTTPFYRTSGSRLVAGQTGFGMWEERCQSVVKEAAKKRAVLHVGSLTELMDVGKSESNPTGIATFLRPAIARGELLCVAEATPEQLPLIEKEDPQLLDAFRVIELEEPGPERGRAILRRFAAADRRREPTLAALAVIDRLHRRFATYSAYPGRPLRFLDRLRRDGERGTAIDEREVYAAFSRETGLPVALLDPAVPFDPIATREWFASRVVGQAEAVDLVTDLLATVKAGLARPNRPVASLLFVGPTGVGKTEMAKALAEFLFGSADRLTRFDMSEYADPVAVRRLVGGAFGTEGLLTAAVREQPFSVLLLDEVEKADRSAFDLLLQALGEARLTDAGGRLADFRNAVVILTSNLGAESFRTGAAGFGAAGSNATVAAAHFARAVEQSLRPEMVNRLDRIVSFAPLGSDVVRRIADREWGKVLARDGVRGRGVRVTTADGVLDRLAAVGFDPRYGARPLKRTIERELLAPLSRQLCRYPGDTPLAATIGIDAGAVQVTIRPVQGGRAASGSEPTCPAGVLATQAQDRRRWHQLLERSSAVRELENDVYQLEQREKRVRWRQTQGKPQRPGDAEAMARLGRLRELVAEVRRQRTTTVATEDEIVVAFHAGADDLPPELTARLEVAEAEWDSLLFRLYAVNRSGADRVTLVLFSEHRGHLTGMANAYFAEAERHRQRVTTRAFVAVSAEEAATVEKKRTPPPFRQGDGPATAWGDDYLWEKSGAGGRVVMRTVPPTDPLPEGMIGVGSEIAGPAADLRFAAEAGLHRFAGLPPDSGNPDVLVVATGEALAEYRPPVAMVRRGAVKADTVRRIYHRGQGRVDDRELDRTFEGLEGELFAMLPPVLAATARHRLLAVVLE